MLELNKIDTWFTLRKRPVFYELRRIFPYLSKDSFSNGKDRWYIVSAGPASKVELPDVIRIFEQHLGPALKPENEPVVPNLTVPEGYIHYLNQMHYNLFMGIALRSDMITLQQLVDAGVTQQGGCSDPPINLFDKDA